MQAKIFQYIVSAWCLYIMIVLQLEDIIVSSYTGRCTRRSFSLRVPHNFMVEDEPRKALEVAVMFENQLRMCKHYW